MLLRFHFKFLLFITVYKSTLPGQGVYIEDLTNKVDLSSYQGQLMAFGDINSDSTTDLVISTDTEVQVLLADPKGFFTLQNSYSVNISEYDTEAVKIVNVAPADYNLDGLVDLAVMYIRKNNASLIYVWLFTNKGHAFESSGQLGAEFTSQLCVLDVNGDSIPDFFTESPGALGRNFYITHLVNGSIAHKLEKQESIDKVMVPHSNSFIDLDGDCLADLFVTSADPVTGLPQIEVWLNNHRQFKRYKKENLLLDPEVLRHMGIFSFGDFDGDGHMDMIAPFCQRASGEEKCANSSIYIFFNVPKDKKPSELCKPREFYFSMEESLHIPLEDSRGALLSFFYERDMPNLPLRVAIGDYDADGYPDLLIVVRDSSGRRQVALLRNEIRQAPERQGGMRMIESETLASIENPLYATFFDIFEKGRLDILVACGKWDMDSKTTRVFTKAFTFRDISDSFFVKTIVMSRPKSASPVVGAFLAAQFVDIHGNRVTRVGSFMPSACYYSLGTPYVVVGLGRTTNYIDSLSVTVPFSSNNLRLNHHEFPAVIPNSQLIIFPQSTNDPPRWTIKIYLLPRRVVLWVAVAALCSCAVLATIVATFHLLEKSEDEKEKRKMRHLFNYRAL